MKKLSVVAFFASLFLLSGCQNMLKTMVSHIRIDKTQTAFIAKGNSYVNFCLSENAINKQAAYDFSTVAAEMLELVVFDNDFYKNTYEDNIASTYAEKQNNPSSVEPSCRQLEEKLPEITANLRTAYRSYTRQLGVSRSQEYQKLAESMANFRPQNTPLPQMTFPNINYSQEKSKTQNFLINTGSGLTQCRVTNGNFVFCL